MVLVGIVSFLILFIFATTLYPGGSHVDTNAQGFDWKHNYLCNLMHLEGINGEPNAGFAFVALAIALLFSSMLIFFFQFAEFIAQRTIWKKVIKTGGTLAMIAAALIFTPYHDLMTIIASVFGLFVITGLLIELHYSNLFSYKILGYLCLILMAMNNIIYNSSFLIEWLPILQKITFLIVLIWILGLSREIHQRIDRSVQ